jgi:hypothetical protein
MGHDSHGVIRVGKYLEWMRSGWLRPNQSPSIVFESDTIAIIDGNRGFGQVVGEFAGKTGTAKAAKTGIAMVGLRNGHLGASRRLGGTFLPRARFRSISSTPQVRRGGSLRSDRRLSRKSDHRQRPRRRRNPVCGCDHVDGQKYRQQRSRFRRDGSSTA